MPMSEYMRGLREKVGTTVIEIPTVSVLIFDERKRALLVRHAEGNDWTTPGGMIEPYETPADAAVRSFLAPEICEIRTRGRSLTTADRPIRG